MALLCCHLHKEMNDLVEEGCVCVCVFVVHLRRRGVRKEGKDTSVVNLVV